MTTGKQRHSRPWWPWLFAAGIGTFAGLGTFTFRYAEGLSYFSKRPEACVNCHIMQTQYDGWQKASHHTAAVCVDCHLPERFIPKYIAKAENGWRHGQRFTTQNFAEPMFVQEAGRRILENNCIRCHGPLVATMEAHAGLREDTQCLHCHANVGHGVRTGLGGPLRAGEIDALLHAPDVSQRPDESERESAGPQRTNEPRGDTR